MQHHRFTIRSSGTSLCAHVPRNGAGVTNSLEWKPRITELRLLAVLLAVGFVGTGAAVVHAARSRPVRAGAQATRPRSDSAEIAALEHRVEEATMRGDVAFLDSVYAPSFRFKHSTGNLEQRADRLAALRASRTKVFARDLDSLDVEVHDDIALSTGRIHVRQDSRDPKWREYTIRYARVYVRRAGRWQLLTHHSTGESFGPLPK